ncbi:MAG: hypothetical protein EPN61_11570 [Burkholderiaceae bacterium]|nr:MAG: hypothetical protein EPN61_11570 [Burkholderiaceae bacterium]
MNMLLHSIGSEKSVPVIVGDLEAAREQFRLIAGRYGGRRGTGLHGLIAAPGATTPCLNRSP